MFISLINNNKGINNNKKLKNKEKSNLKQINNNDFSKEKKEIIIIYELFDSILNLFETIFKVHNIEYELTLIDITCGIRNAMLLFLI